MIKRRALARGVNLVGVLALVALSASCSSSSSDDSGSASVTPPPGATWAVPTFTNYAAQASPTALPPTTSVPVAPTDLRSLDHNPLEPYIFSSSDLAISCFLGEGSGSTEMAHCDLAKRSWPAGPAPKDCYLDWARAVEVEPNGPARFICSVDTYKVNANILSPGHALVRGYLRCTGLVRAIRCENEVTKHGFVVADGAFSLF